MRTPNGCRNDTEATLAAVAAAQYGTFHARQATEVGFTAKMRQVRIQGGRWDTLHPAVYRLAGALDSWHQRLMAACLAAGPAAVASHRSAGALWGFDGLSVGRVEVTLPGATERRLAGVTSHRTRSLVRLDVGERDGIPVTRPGRTLVDLAAVLDRTRLEAALDSALREGQVSVGHVLGRLDDLGSQGRAGMVVLRDLLDERRGTRGHECVREAELARLLDTPGRPPLVRQYELRDGDGTLVARFDLADPVARVAVEFDSYRHHFGRQAWRRDQARHNRATALGWLVFHVTADDLRAGDALGQAVGRAREAASSAWRMQAAMPSPR